MALELEHLQKLSENETSYIYEPRSPWFDFFLTLFTFTFSTWFWFVARVREINSLSDKAFKPWLWFFVPAVPLAQLFALPKLFGAIDDLSEQYQIPYFRVWKVFCFVFIFGATAYSNLMDKIELPFSLFFMAVFFYSVAIGVIQYRLNKVKNELEGLMFRKIPTGYKIWEWVLLIVGFPLTLTAFYFLVIAPAFEKSTPIAKGVLDNSGQAYQLTILESGWKMVEVGTYSDGSAELELGGPLFDMYFVVFPHGFSESVSSISYWRQKQILAADSSFTCDHTRFFEKQSLKVSALITCNSQTMGDPLINISKVIETDKGIFEMYGYFTSASFSFNEHNKAFIDMAKGFTAK